MLLTHTRELYWPLGLLGVVACLSRRISIGSNPIRVVFFERKKMESAIVPKQEIEAQVKKAKEKEGAYKGMHSGTVAGKSFEKSRRNRKTHSQRRAQISSAGK